MGRRLHVETDEPAFKAGTPEYEADVIKRARKAATAIGKTLEHYKLIGEALSIIRQKAMVEAGIAGSNKPPAGPKYAKALNALLDKAPEFLAPEVFESGSARTHCVWLHDCAADVEWTFQVAERDKPGSTRRWNHPTYIWKQWRRMTAEPTKKAVDAKVAREAKAKAQAEELERYRNEWKVKYEAVKAELDAIRFDAKPPGEELAELIANDPYREVEIVKPKRVRRTPKRKDGEPDEVGGYAPGALEAITGKPKRQRKPKAADVGYEHVNDFRFNNASDESPALSARLKKAKPPLDTQETVN